MANTPYIDLVKPAGTDKALISVLNANSDKIDSAVGGVQDALAIVCNGNTHGAITSGQYVYVRAHETLQEGLYTANSNIAANATLSSSNLTANSSGGLNALNEQIGTLNTSLTQHSIYASSKLDVYTLSPHMGILYFTGLEITGETNINDVIPSGYRSAGLQRCGVICDGNGDFTCLVTILATGALNLTPNTNNTKSFYGTVLFRY